MVSNKNSDPSSDNLFIGEGTEEQGKGRGIKGGVIFQCDGCMGMLGGSLSRLQLPLAILNVGKIEH